MSCLAGIDLDFDNSEGNGLVEISSANVMQGHNCFQIENLACNLHPLPKINKQISASFQGVSFVKILSYGKIFGCVYSLKDSTLAYNNVETFSWIRFSRFSFVRFPFSIV